MRWSPPAKSRASIHGWRFRLVLMIAMAMLVGTLPGCSLGVMAGKMIFGDPRMPAEFTMATGVNLVDSDHTVVVVARVPTYLSGDLATLEPDLITGVTDQLLRESIQATPADEVIDWIDERGSSDAVDAAAEKFGTDFVIHIDLSTFENLEEKTSWLHRGRSAGTVTAFKVETIDGKKVPRMIFERGFDERHPRRQPVPVGEVSRTVFVRRHLDQLTNDLARKFHTHLPGAGI
ncbi:MAG: hypothetical protein VX311_01895 [Planctomycetota bacterium]|nr:hypothetical protein [Planctomycetota bacterium]MEC9010470.1 hypothetical protein [Planctomycetota bacterium]MEE3283305.1 hypothetical protein [Planctomycetota bacterium]MEE3364612.1 hypothetical protein [Planctomycetota bacterium]